MATCHSIHGSNRLPTTNINTIKKVTCSNVKPMVCHNGVEVVSVDSPPKIVARGGINTNTKTVNKSSTTNQPTAILPLMLSNMPLDSSAFSSTTVLAHESAKPNMSPSPNVQPHQLAKPMPNNVAIAICTMAPGSAMRLTDIKSLIEKCKPTPNISNITPISDN